MSGDLIERLREEGRDDAAIAAYLSAVSPLSDGDGWQPIAEAKIREILAGTEGVTPGPWHVYEGCSWRRIGTDPGRGAYDCAVLAPCVAPDGHPDLTSSAGDREANLAHFARLDPATVAAMASELLAAREALRPFADRFEAWSKVGPGPYEDEEYSPKLFSAMQAAARVLSGNRSWK